MDSFNIWAEGFAATGQSGGAVFMGSNEGEDFKDACDKFFIEEDHKIYYDSNNLTYWGCKLFDNELDAKVSFG